MPDSVPVCENRRRAISALLSAISRQNLAQFGAQRWLKARFLVYGHNTSCCELIFACFSLLQFSRL
jgi:hypothetical protein